ncbi:MAG: hypothetical protein Q4B87_03410 [Candidatus Saccharibacteria bacterium]|nr:hypothetical protein [Candidatus Saccharibacteria bacterium]
MKEKDYIPGTNPAWDRELPDENYNSLVDKHGRNYDNGYNFDEPKDKEDEEDQEPEEFDPEKARKAREEAIENLKNPS